VTGCHRINAPARPRSSVSIGLGVPLGKDGTLGTPVDASVRESLVALAWDGRATDRLAERWEPLEGDHGLRFYLRPGIQFHDGTVLTPDLAASILRRGIPSLGLSSSSITAIQAEPGANAIVVRTSRPEAFLLTDLADSALTQDGKPNIGTGPYALETTTPWVKLRAFDKYYRGPPAIDTVEFRSYAGLRGAWAAMLRGEIDVLHDVSRDAAEFVEGESTVESFSFVSPYYTLLAFNMKHPVLGRPEVRRALSLAVDRDALVRQALRGRGEPAHGPIWPSHWAHTSTSRAYSYNPEAAKLRLEAAGLPMRPPSSPGQMPSRFAFDCLLWANDARFERLAIVVQKQLYDIGVDMRIVPVMNQEWGARMGAGKFDAFLASQTTGRSLAWVYRFWHTPPPGQPAMLDAGYHSADAVLDRMRSAMSDREMREAVDDLQKVLYDDPPAVFLVWPQTTRALRSDIRVPKETVPDVMGTLWRWQRGAPSPAP
jgi:peptide/nickel transport system substrate-binding protein